MGKVSISFTNSIVKEEERKYLRTLPAHIKVEFQLNSDRLNLLLGHGSLRNRLMNTRLKIGTKKAC